MLSILLGFVTAAYVAAAGLLGYRAINGQGNALHLGLIASGYLIFVVFFVAMDGGKTEERATELRDSVERVATAQEMFRAEHEYYAADLENLAMVYEPELLGYPADMQLQLVGGNEEYVVVASTDEPEPMRFTIVARTDGVIGICDAPESAGCDGGRWRPQAEPTVDRPDAH